jgi:hypothetical protein
LWCILEARLQVIQDILVTILFGLLFTGFVVMALFIVSLDISRIHIEFRTHARRSSIRGNGRRLTKGVAAHRLPNKHRRCFALLFIPLLIHPSHNQIKWKRIEAVSASFLTATLPASAL